MTARRSTNRFDPPDKGESKVGHSLRITSSTADIASVTPRPSEPCIRTLLAAPKQNALLLLKNLSGNILSSETEPSSKMMMTILY